MSDFGTVLSNLNRIPGVRGSMVIAAEDGLVIEADLMIGVAGPAVAALAASLFRRAQRSLTAADLGAVQFLQLEADNGLLFAAGSQERESLLAVVTDTRANVGMLRLAAAAAAEQLP